MGTYRTVLEQKIRERRQTFEEFAEYVEAFAEEHNEPGTLSLRHLQRLVAGQRPDGSPLGPVLPVTARLLEHIFGLSIAELLSPPSTVPTAEDFSAEIRRRIHVSSRIDGSTIRTLNDQLNATRRLDRQLGAIVAHDEVRTKSKQVTQLLDYSLSDSARERLAALCSEFYCLAAWQALDLGRIIESWRYYSEARTIALEANIPAYLALAEAGRAFALIDAGEKSCAVDLLENIRQTTDRQCSQLLRAWLAAAHGETLAANGEHARSLRAFDQAAELLLPDPVDPDGPYVALDAVHLGRWRGNALAQLADADAIEVLSSALDELDPSFTRAETALRVDLATALAARHERDEAQLQAHRATELAARIGSVRQQRRMKALAPAISS
ncbi:MAG: hypothetical protein JO287_13085 [Pseudonocardiales bacterium]|nr:hypothetical protein [Pseudonocardiales bacterium]